MPDQITPAQAIVEIREVLEPDWNHAKILARFLTDADEARVKAIAAIIARVTPVKVDYSEPPMCRVKHHETGDECILKPGHPGLHFASQAWPEGGEYNFSDAEAKS